MKRFIITFTYYDGHTDQMALTASTNKIADLFVLGKIKDPANDIIQAVIKPFGQKD